MPKKLQNREAILADYVAGVKVEVIAMTYGCSITTPSSIAKSLGIKTRKTRSDTLFKDVARTAKSHGVKFAAELHCVTLAYAYKCIKKAAG